ncbi:hypothetical protein ACIBI0_28330 [Microbispora rosea]|uniref:hypothetical protein n=1 Tax=Microbispora rosea TaxID=58117 RepID=UPI0037AC074C
MSAATEQDVIDVLPAQHNPIKAMFAEVAAARGERKRAPPCAGESATANMLAGPSVAVFDKIRDTVLDWRQSNKD